MESESAVWFRSDGNVRWHLPRRGRPAGGFMTHPTTTVNRCQRALICADSCVFGRWRQACKSRCWFTRVWACAGPPIAAQTASFSGPPSHWVPLHLFVRCTVYVERRRAERRVFSLSLGYEMLLIYGLGSCFILMSRWKELIKCTDLSTYTKTKESNVCRFFSSAHTSVSESSATASGYRTSRVSRVT